METGLRFNGTSPMERRRESAEVEEVSHTASRTRAAVATTQHTRVSTPSRETEHALNRLSLVPVATIQSAFAPRGREQYVPPPPTSAGRSFAEVALANCSDELARNPSREHLPSRLYIAAGGNYNNIYPKTDYAYSRLSRDRVELAPGQVAMPNLSRRSLEQFRREGPRYAPQQDDIHTNNNQVTRRVASFWGHDNGASRRWPWLLLALLLLLTLLLPLLPLLAHGSAPFSACEGGIDEAAVRRIVAELVQVYDADKTGLVDYAQASAGGRVVSTRSTELYTTKTDKYVVQGVPVWWRYKYSSPRSALTPGAMPNDCFAFVGFPGYLVVQLYAVIEVTGYSVEHMSRLLASRGNIDSAPKNFSVYGLRDKLDQEPHLFGHYIYDEAGTPVQHFAVQFPKTRLHGDVGFEYVELRIESNHGNPYYTCLYRFRVHGSPLDDVSQASEDSFEENSNT